VRVFYWSTLSEGSSEALSTSVLVKYLELSSEMLCASVLVKSGLEIRDYGRRGSAALTMRHPSIRKSWH
jgi:hypothetical protein